ncbi:MAG: MFS transporter [Thermomicrobiales bacterium]
MSDTRQLDLSPQARTILIWMCILIAVNQLGFGAVVPVIALYAQDFDVSQTAIGLTIAIYGLARFLINVPAGQLADKVGRKATLALGGAVTVAGTILCAVAPDYEIFLIARFIAGAGGAFVLTGGQIVLADIASPQNRGRVMAIYQGVFLFAVGAGSFPGGWLATHVSLSSPFWANAAVVTLLALIFVPETKPDTLPGIGGTSPHGSQVKLTFLQQVNLMVAIPGFLLVSVLSFVAYFARTGGLFNVIPLLGENKIGLAPDQIGFGIGMISVVGLVLVYPAGTLVDRYDRKSVIVPSAILSAGAMLLFMFASSFTTFLVASFFWSVSSGIAGAAPAAYATDLAPRGMIAPAMGMYRTVADLGYVVGPLLLGAISDLKLPEMALAFTAALLLGSGTIFAIRAPESLPGRLKSVSAAGTP